VVAHGRGWFFLVFAVAGASTGLGCARPPPLLTDDLDANDDTASKGDTASSEYAAGSPEDVALVAANAGSGRTDGGAAKGSCLPCLRASCPGALLACARDASCVGARDGGPPTEDAAPPSVVALRTCVAVSCKDECGLGPTATAD
jgi:hypothetical protein